MWSPNSAMLYRLAGEALTRTHMLRRTRVKVEMGTPAKRAAEVCSALHEAPTVAQDRVELLDILTSTTVERMRVTSP